MMISSHHPQHRSRADGGDPGGDRAAPAAAQLPAQATQEAGGLSPAQIQRRARQAARQQARTASCAELAAARKRIDELQLQLTILVAAIKAGRCPLQPPGLRRDILETCPAAAVRPRRGLETISEEVDQGAAPLQGDRGSPADAHDHTCSVADMLESPRNMVSVKQMIVKI